MATEFRSSIFLLLLLLFATALRATAFGGKVGGRTPVKHVESNQEIQDLGRYCVQEYNRQLQHQGNGSSSAKLLSFSRVVAAETQVVSGIKYYLKITAASRTGGGPARTFDAVVVVKSWLGSKDLVSFTPSSPPAYTK